MNSKETKNVLSFVIVFVISMLFNKYLNFNEELIILGFFEAFFIVLMYKEIELFIDSKKIILVMSAFFASPWVLFVNIALICILPQILITIKSKKHLDIKYLSFDSKWFFALTLGIIILSIREYMVVDFKNLNEHVFLVFSIISFLIFDLFLYLSENKWKNMKEYMKSYDFNKSMGIVYLSLLSVAFLNLLTQDKMVYVVLIMSILKGVEITTHKNLNNHIKWQNTMRDEMTGVYNKNNLKRTLADRIGRKNPFTLIMIDLNEFKKINDTFGHVVGDDVLMHFTYILSKVVRFNDIYRYGGDEFCVLIDSKEVFNRIKSKTDILLHQIPYNINGQNIYLSASYGCIESEGEDTTVEILIDLADKNMYENKRKITKEEI